MDGQQVCQLDVTVDVDFKENIKLIFEAVRPQWNWQDVRSHEFKTGITNKITGYYLSSDESWQDMVLIRRYGEKTENIIDRSAEQRNMQIMHSAGCGTPLYATLNNGLVYGFVPGSVTTPQNIRQSDISSLVAEQMCKMHQIDVSSWPGMSTSTPALFSKLREFLSGLPATFSKPEYQAMWETSGLSVGFLEEECNMLENIVTEHCKSPLVFCHNDLLLENIIYSSKENKVTFIDYEYGDINYEYYDIADHFCEFAGVETVDHSKYPDREFQYQWFRNYFGTRGESPSEEFLAQVYNEVNLFSLCSHFYWGVWAMVQAENSSIDFNFMIYSKQRLDEYFSKKDERLAFIKK